MSAVSGLIDGRQCGVCHEYLGVDREDLKQTKCKHLFHKYCLARHIEQSPSCPVCFKVKPLSNRKTKKLLKRCPPPQFPFGYGVNPSFFAKNMQEIHKKDHKFFESAYGTKLHEAVENGDLKAVQKWVKKYPHLVNTLNEEGYSPLHVALDDYYCSKIKFEMNNFGDESTSEERHEEKEYATDKEIVRTLIEGGADVNQFCSNGDTPLHIVSDQKDKYRRNELVGWLIDAGANVCLFDVDGNTPLHIFLRDNMKSTFRIIADREDIKLDWTRMVFESLNSSVDDYDDRELLRHLIEEEKIDTHRLALMIAEEDIYDCPRLINLFHELIREQFAGGPDVKKVLKKDPFWRSRNVKREILGMKLMKKAPAMERFGDKIFGETMYS